MKSLQTNSLGKKYLVEECQSITISNFLKTIDQKLSSLKGESKLDANGTSTKLTTSKTGVNGTRYWFQCSSCERRVGIIFVHPISQNLGCRTCLGLEYRKRRYKGMVENNYK